jgi:anti-sigma factor ChrR (cupin superfamily)
MAFEMQHPDAATLEAFALGRIASDAMDRVAMHLGACPACRRVVQAAPGDRLVALLRRDVSRGVPGAAVS